MKELIKAKKLYDQVIELDSEIIRLERAFEDFTKTKSGGSIRISFNSDKVEPIKEEQELTLMLMPKFFDLQGEKIPDFNDFYESDLTESELIVVIGGLLKYKQEYREKLVNEFNKLSIKLKI